MAAPAVTYTFSNGTTSDASQVNTNFTDLINALTDGTSDIHVGTLNAEGACTFDGAVTLGDATADDITFTGSLASSIPVKTNATYNLGSSTSALASVYLGNGSNKTLRLLPGTIGTSWTLTFPNDVPSITGQTLVFNTSGTAEFRYPDKFTAEKTADYTATGDETVILCNATTTGSFTVTLPAASTMTGKELTIIRTDNDLSRTVTIDANSTETIVPSVQSGQLTYVLYTQYESVTLKCNGTGWYRTAAQTSTSWVDYDPTFTGWGTPSAIDFKWRRVGDSMEIRGVFTSGVATAVIGRISLPTGASLDTAKLNGVQTEALGFIYMANSTVATTPINTRGPFPLVYQTSQTTTVSMVREVDTDDVLFDLGTTVADTLWSSGTKGSVSHLTVPISGWNP